MTFSVFLEAAMHDQLASFVSAMIQDRYNHQVRLVATDWLDDVDEHDLANLIRISQQVYDNNKDENLQKYTVLLLKVKKELAPLDIRHTITYDSKMYRLNIDGIEVRELNKFKTQLWQHLEVADCNDLLLKGILVLFAQQMATSSKAKPEHVTDLDQVIADLNIYDLARTRNIFDYPSVNRALQRLIKVLNYKIIHHIDFNFHQRLRRTIDALLFWLQEPPPPETAKLMNDAIAVIRKKLA